jgi:tRNA G18 (ribose-2'-O)-methylase SpoU
VVDIYLYKVGRNLNRAYRTCEAFGVKNLYLIDCDAKLSGNLFKSQGLVNVINSQLPYPEGLLSLETYHTTPIENLDLSVITSVIIGGETHGLPKRLDAQYRATIPMFGKISGLTVEATLAIALYEITRQKRSD